ncbi:response regulator [Roseateles amylovorans]|uniref:Response regulator n=1 Tax=Roseateles amylovorans TaxID=2978473 RepID=A0ABY6B0P4_9BURK|nr:response regulator [Roseateles amylovorans]UXH77751.1 response regulator [Roseateles amylovorans]
MKIVVVEDCLPVRRLLVGRVECEAGVSVVAQASGEDEAVQAVMATTPDVVLLDLQLSPGSGLAVLSRLRRQSFAGKVFVLSSEDRAIYAPLCTQRGANGFYDKAFDVDRLMGDLHDLCCEGAPRLRRCGAPGPRPPMHLGG